MDSTWNPSGLQMNFTEVFTFPRLFRMESMWNPWNEYWLRPQPISYSMDMMDSMWNEDEMIKSTWIPHGFHMDSIGFHMECRHIHHGFHGTNLIPW